MLPRTALSTPPPTMTHPLRSLLLASLCALALTTSCSTTITHEANGSSYSADLAAPEATLLDELDWLAGTWSGDMWGGRFVAHYTTPEGGMIISHSRLLLDGMVSFYEFEVFELQGESVHFQPFPGGEPAEGLTLTTHDQAARRAVFENPDKDFPTQITFERVADDQLVITLSDPHGWSGQVEVFELFR